MNISNKEVILENGDFLKASARAIGERRETYGSPREGFDRAAVIASALLDKQVLPHEIALILHAVKLARIASSPANPDHYIDGISYLAFAGEFMEVEPARYDTQTVKPAPVTIEGRPVIPTR